MLLQTPAPPFPVDVNRLIEQIIPLVGATVALIVGGVVLYAFFRSDLAAALAERIRAGIKRKGGGGGAGDWLGLGMTTGAEPRRVAELEERVDALHGQVNELAERLDFAERLLAQQRARSLPGA